MSHSVQSSPSKSMNGGLQQQWVCEFCNHLMEPPEDDPDVTIITGPVKFWDAKKWKFRFGVLTKISPAADCLHLQLYRDSKDRYKQNQTKASLSLQYFLGIESGFTLDKESNTIAILCQDLTVVLAFDTRERLIQWQVKIAYNLGEDEQYLIQVCSAPSKSKIVPGPARLHVQDHRFSITTGVPPRLAGVWNLSHLRRFGVVETRFCFEGGSICGKWEGLYVLITDQGEEITRSLKLASEGNLLPRRKPITRNMSVLESPRRLSQMRDDCGDDKKKMNDGNGLWESESTCDFGDATSVGEPSDIQVGWKPERPIGRCISCMSKLGAMSRSSTVAPGIGFSSIRENSIGENQSDDSGCSVSNSGSAEVQSSVITSSCLADRVSVVDSGGTQSKSCHGSPSRKNHLSPSSSMILENYDIPKNICVAQKNHEENHCSEGEFYDTPKKIRDTISGCPTEKNYHCRSYHSCCHPTVTVHTPCLLSCCQVVCPCVQKIIPHQPTCPCIKTQYQQEDRNDAIYAVVDLAKKTRNKGESNTVSSSSQKEEQQCVVNYENMGFVKSCEYYENVKDIVVWCHGSDKCKKCDKNTEGDDYLMMGPIAEGPPYLPMRGGPTREVGESKSATNTPCLRRHGVTSCYSTLEGREAAQVRRRSNSMDSGRCLEESQSAAASTDSLLGKTGVATLQSLTKRLLSQSKPDSVSRRSLSVKPSNRDSSSSNDSGVSTGSLKHCTTEFLEFETLVTPFSNAVKLTAPTSSPKRSKSTEPLQELSFQFSEIRATATEPIPPCPKKECFKDLSMSSSSGTSTIPYIDSVSTSSGASDMSDYIETLSLSSYSSSDAQDNLRLNHTTATVLKPRSGKEYQKIDRNTIEVITGKTPKPTEVQTDSPSPGYVSSSSN